MAKVDRILRDLYPGRETFTEEERRLVQRCIVAVNNDAPRSRMPRSDHPIGSVSVCDGHRLKAVRRGFVLEPRNACDGCWFKNHGRNCYGYRCSRFDRADETNVWFVEVTDEG